MHTNTPTKEFSTGQLFHFVISLSLIDFHELPEAHYKKVNMNKSFKYGIWIERVNANTRFLSVEIFLHGFPLDSF